MDEWKQIPGFPKYLISSCGLCMSTAYSEYRILKPRYLRGYVRYALYSGDEPARNRSAHRLVWEAFVGPIPDAMEINHINGVKDDNRLPNLEVVTHDENMHHRKFFLNVQGVRGSKNNLAKLTEPQVEEIYALLDSGLSHQRIAGMFGVSRPTISLISSGKTWPHLHASRFNDQVSAEPEK